MKVLIDECAPRALRNFLNMRGQECLTVQDVGWSGKQNGELLAMAESQFDILVTLDANLRHQQNLPRQKIGIVVILARSNRLSDLSPHFLACADAVGAIPARTNYRCW